MGSDHSFMTLSRPLFARSTASLPMAASMMFLRRNGDNEFAHASPNILLWGVCIDGVEGVEQIYGARALIPSDHRSQGGGTIS
jgi:hypothetical protein